MSDLKTRARVFLDFAIDSVVEGLSDADSDPECYSEADHAIACLDRIFEREASDDVFIAQLTMIGLFETKFARIYRTSRPSERGALLRESLDRLRLARTKFD
jgi:hypothetical protein